VGKALRDWKAKRALSLQEREALKAEIDEGLADVAAGRVKAFDTDQIIARGRMLSAARAVSG
jgi:antitoxin ParD1/3/4